MPRVATVWFTSARIVGWVAGPEEKFSAAPGFFGHLDPIMRDDVVLAITRLMDPPRTGRRENAPLGGLIELLAAHVDAVELASWQSELALLNAAVKPLRAVRDRFVAHEDLATALKYHPQPLPGFSRAGVEALLERIRGLFNSIEEKFLGSHTSHELTIADGGEHLSASLERARAQKPGSY
jgi:hypothetical protein